MKNQRLNRSRILANVLADFPCFILVQKSHLHIALVSQSLLYSFPHPGLLADKLGSYVIPFQVAGGITIAGSFIPPIILLCYQRHQRTASILYEHEGEKLLNNSSEANYQTITNDESKI